MPKLTVNQVSEVLKKEQLDPAVLRRIAEQLALLAQGEAVEGAAAPVKKQFCIVISDPDHLLPKTDFSGWVVQIPENESVATTVERIHRAAYDFNASKKGRLLPVKTVGEAIENVPGKVFKEADVWVKTKTPVLMLRTDNEIPGVDVAQMRLMNATTPETAAPAA